jgi:hypothetical protein
MEEHADILPTFLRIFWYGRADYLNNKQIVKLLRLAKLLEIYKFDTIRDNNLRCHSYKEAFELLEIINNTQYLDTDYVQDNDCSFYYNYNFKFLEFNEVIKKQILECTIDFIIDYLTEPPIDDFLMVMLTNTDESFRDFIFSITNFAIIERNRNPNLNLVISVSKYPQCYLDALDYLRYHKIKLTGVVYQDFFYILEINNDKSKKETMMDIIFRLLLSQTSETQDYLGELVTQAIDNEIKTNNRTLTRKILEDFLLRKPDANSNNILKNIYQCNKSLFAAIVMAYHNNDLDLSVLSLCFKCYKMFIDANRVGVMQIQVDYDQINHEFEYANIYQQLYKYHKFTMENIQVKNNRRCDGINYVNELRALLTKDVNK